MNTLIVGARGERTAAKYLKNSGYKTVCKNYRVRGGEIDLICENEDFIVFVEVKTRRKGSLTSGVDAVNKKKRERIVVAAKLYLASHETEKQPRFDVVEVSVDQNNYTVLQHIESAFGEY